MLLQQTHQRLGNPDVLKFLEAEAAYIALSFKDN